MSVQTLPKKENAEAVVAVALSTRQADMALQWWASVESVINRDRSRPRVDREQAGAWCEVGVMVCGEC